MDVYLDMTGTITDMESENFAMYQLAEEIKKRFAIPLSTAEVLRRIEEYRKPIMERRDKEYVPIRHLVLEAVKKIVPRPLCANDSYWILDEYSAVHSRYVKLAPEALEGLQVIRKVAKHMGLITDADRPFTDRLLKSLGISKFFNSITTAEDVGVGKPNPRIFAEALKNGSSKLKIYIGDSEKRDVKGAKGVGMIVIKIGKISQSADYTATNLLEAAKIIQNLPEEDNP